VPVVTWSAWLGDTLAAIRADDQWRAMRSFDALGCEGVVGERPVVSFGSNDYLGLSHHPAVIEAAHQALHRWGAGAGASRLVAGTRPIHQQLEARLARWKRCPAALVFPTGYAANLAVLTAVADGGVTIFSDQLNHASIIDGCRLSQARVVVYRHGDAVQLADLLENHEGRALVVSESVFSMDGDLAPVGALVDICRRNRALLVLDEAHAVLGPGTAAAGADDGDRAWGQGAGRGAAFEDVDVIRVGTLSKALGSLGGFVAASRSWVELLVNRARPFIFTTATTPADTAAALAALTIVDSHEGAALVRRLRDRVNTVRPGHRSPIVPIVLGDERAALEASARLLHRGLLVPAIRPPAVPPGTSRLRIALSAAHTDEQLGRLTAALDELGLGVGVAP